MSKALIRFYDLRLLQTIDLNLLLQTLAAELPGLNRIVMEVMDDNERTSSSQTDDKGIILVQDRIHIYIGGDSRIRRRDLETAIERSSP